MALSSSQLATAIKNALEGIDVSSGEIDATEVSEALAQAIVDHITSNAQVVVGSGSSAGTYPVI